MCPRFPRRHTVVEHDRQCARDLTLTWIPGQGVRAVETRAGGVDPARPETYPSEGEPIQDGVMATPAAQVPSRCDAGNREEVSGEARSGRALREAEAAETGWEARANPTSEVPA